MTNKKPAAKQKPMHVVRAGEVIGEVFSRQSNAGYLYFDFTISRRFTARNSGREVRGASFFHANEEDLVAVIRGACEWIREHLHAELPNNRGPTERKEI